LLLYNQRKEFIGIDSDDLSDLGYNNINELINESEDFADLFVKKPGYIHNFKNFSWIDFILHSESDESKALIHANGKNFACSLHVEPFHFKAEESGYCVNIKNLRELKGAEDAQVTKDVQNDTSKVPSPAKPAPIKKEVTTPEIKEEQKLEILLDDISIPDAPDTSFQDDVELPSFQDIPMQELQEPDLLDIPHDDISEDFNMPTENEFGAPLDINYDDLKLDDIQTDEFELPEEEIIQESLAIEENTVESAPMLGDYVSDLESDNEHLSDLVKSGTYKYNPQIAADELGLPVDLIEEFIGDFIDQAHEFNEDLYASVKSEDFDNVQVLSHKLKGVAANLRVEDAFDVLSVVNSSKDTDEVLANLNQFYRIIAKLEGKEIKVAPTPIAKPIVEEAPSIVEDDIYDNLLTQPSEESSITDELKLEDDDDELYADLLADENTTLEDNNIANEKPSIEEDDIYADLLAEPSHEKIQSDNSTEQIHDEEDIYDNLIPDTDISVQEPKIEDASLNLDDDIYDNMLALPEDDNLAVESLMVNDLTIQDEVKTSAPEIEVQKMPTLNFDVQKSANELGIPLDIVEEFVQDFKVQVDTHQKDFDEAIKDNNIQGINRTATLLKGMSDNLRLNDISEVLKELQQEININNTSKNIALLQAYSDQL